MSLKLVKGIDFHYSIAGSGPPVLLIHGLGSSLYDWEQQVSEFSKHYTVITFDVRGHGQTEKPPGPYSVEMFADDALHLMLALEFRYVHVVGLSMGGMIGLQMALDAPKFVRSLVVANSGPYVPQDTFQQKMEIFQRKILFRLFSMRRIGEVIGARLFPEPHEERLLEMFVDRWAENDKRAYMDATESLLKWDVRDRLPEIGCPVLVLASELDYTPVEAKQEYMKSLKKSELVVIPGARHAVAKSAPEAFNKAVLAFLNKHA